MDLSNLKPAKGSVHHEKRIGRGPGSGHGGTATRGHKGAKSRSGYSSKKTFEGGQMPLQRRLPKFGFNNVFRKEYKAINISVLQALVDKHGYTSIDIQTLVDAGFASKNDLIKILAKGTLTSKIDVKAHAFSKKAVEVIESLQGSAVKL